MTGHFRSYHFDSGNDGPHVLITAGVHGDEFEPMLAAAELVNCIPGMLKSGLVTIVPVVNKPAFLKATRCGDDGYDLARTCPGNENGSATEKIAASISSLIRKADYYIDMHTGGLIYDIYPLAGYMLHRSEQVLEKQRQMAKAFHLPVVWGTDPYAEGRTLSVARDANVPAIYVEYGGGQNISEEIKEAYVRGCINVLALFDMLTEVKKKYSEPKFHVEDHRLNNGHLQSKMPAPVDGLFLALASKGSFIKKEETWGRIIDPETGNETKIVAGMDGLVLFLRTGGIVKKGDSLGGILPAEQEGLTIIFE